MCVIQMFKPSLLYMKCLNFGSYMFKVFPSILWSYIMCIICGQSELSDLTWTVKVKKKKSSKPS